MEVSTLELKRKVCERLNINDPRPEDLDDNMPLMGVGLDIDSIDVLEMIVMIEEDYGVRIEDREEGAKAFQTFGKLAEYIATHRTPDSWTR